MLVHKLASETHFSHDISLLLALRNKLIKSNYLHSTNCVDLMKNIVFDNGANIRLIISKN